MVSYSNPHSVRCDLAGELRDAVIQYAAKHHLDKEYAVLSLLVKSLRSENLISDEIYRFYLSRYSVPVTNSSPMQQLMVAKPITYDELKAKQKLDEKTRYFQAILAGEWQLHPSLEWRRKVLASAQEWMHQIPTAKLVLDLGGGQLLLNIPKKDDEETIRGPK